MRASIIGCGGLPRIPFLTSKFRANLNSCGILDKCPMFCGSKEQASTHCISSLDRLHIVIGHILPGKENS